MGRSKSSGRWLQEHFADDYVRRAQMEGWRSRAVYKLEEIDRKEKLFRKGMRVVDLGAAPGAWSQFAMTRIGDAGQVLAVDVLPVDPMPRLTFIQGDINAEAVYHRMQAALGERGVDLVLSDMAPNMSGNKAVDQPRAIQLCEMALETARAFLVDGGDLVIKAFEGEGIEALRRGLRSAFAKLKSVKPKASRPRSREIYLVARGLKCR